jgi:hypothetical protein
MFHQKLPPGKAVASTVPGLAVAPRKKSASKSKSGRSSHSLSHTAVEKYFKKMLVIEMNIKKGTAVPQFRGRSAQIIYDLTEGYLKQVVEDAMVLLKAKTQKTFTTDIIIGAVKMSATICKRDKQGKMENCLEKTANGMKAEVEKYADGKKIPMRTDSKGLHRDQNFSRASFASFVRKDAGFRKARVGEKGSLALRFAVEEFIMFLVEEYHKYKSAADSTSKAKNQSNGINGAYMLAVAKALTEKQDSLYDVARAEGKLKTMAGRTSSAKTKNKRNKQMAAVAVATRGHPQGLAKIKKRKASSGKKPSAKKTKTG